MEKIKQSTFLGIIFFICPVLGIAQKNMDRLKYADEKLGKAIDEYAKSYKAELDSANKRYNNCTEQLKNNLDKINKAKSIKKTDTNETDTITNDREPIVVYKNKIYTSKQDIMKVVYDVLDTRNMKGLPNDSTFKEFIPEYIIAEQLVRVSRLCNNNISRIKRIVFKVRSSVNADMAANMHHELNFALKSDLEYRLKHYYGLRPSISIEYIEELFYNANPEISIFIETLKN